MPRPPAALHHAGSLTGDRPMSRTTLIVVVVVVIIVLFGGYNFL